MGPPVIRATIGPIKTGGKKLHVCSIRQPERRDLAPRAPWTNPKPQIQFTALAASHCGLRGVQSCVGSLTIPSSSSMTVISHRAH